MPDCSSVGECIAAICQCCFVMVWSIVSLALGLVFGTIVGIEMTIMVWILTLIRTPCHIVRNIVVAVTTKECFVPCTYLDPMLRVVVTPLVPIPHLLWLILVPFATLIFGTLYYIGKSTKTIFKGSYNKQWQNTITNIRLDRDSKLGEYKIMMNDFDQEDCKDILYNLKGICSFVPGIILGSLPFVPFTVSIVLITLYRLPINVYKTVRVAIRTVTLQWDLKLLAILLVPIIHFVVFPLVMFGSALVGSLVFFTLCTSISIAQGNNPMDDWDAFHEGIQQYYQAHQRFVGETLERYDHPTGIPSGWRGQQYGLPIHQILQWQWDFLACCLLLLIGLPICLVGSVIIFAVKVIPGIFAWWRKLCKHITKTASIEILGCWAFWVCAFLVTPLVAILASAAAITAGTLLALTIPSEYLKYGCMGGLYAPFDVLLAVDSWDFFCLKGCRVFACLPDENPYNTSDKSTIDDDNNNNSSSRRRSQRRRNDRKANKKARQQFANAYWDRFASQCIQTTSDLLGRGWISLEDVQGYDSSVLQTVPAVALLTILFDSVNDDEEAAKTSTILWKVDGTRCEKVEKERLDNIAALLWPKVMDLQKTLRSGRRKKALASDTNAEILGAMLCSNSEESSEALRSFWTEHEEDPKSRAGNIRIRSKLTELSLMILQVRPFQDRMKTIFGYNYMAAVHADHDEESGAAGRGRPELLQQDVVTEEEQSTWQRMLSHWRTLGEEAWKKAMDDTGTIVNS